MQESVTAIESPSASERSGAMHTTVRKWEEGESHAYLARDQHGAGCFHHQGDLSLWARRSRPIRGLGAPHYLAPDLTSPYCVNGSTHKVWTHRTRGTTLVQ